MVNKRNTKRNGPKARRTQNLVRQPSPGQKTVVNYGSFNSHVGRVTGLTNPFSQEAVGAKIPDDDSTPAFTAQVRCFHVMSSDANGHAAVSLSPNALRYNGRSLILDASGVATATSNIENPDHAAYVAQTDQYRIVSWGYRVYSILPGLTAQGTVRLITTDEIPTIGFDIFSNLYSEIHPEAVSSLDAYWTSRPTGVQWKSYIGNESFAAWTYGVVTGSGLPPSSDCFQIEVVYNVEIVPLFGQIGTTLATPAATSSPTALAAASQVHSKKKAAHTHRASLFSQIGSLAREALLDVAATYVPVLGNMAKNALMPRRSTTQYIEVD